MLWVLSRSAVPCVVVAALMAAPTAARAQCPFDWLPGEGVQAVGALERDRVMNADAAAAVLEAAEVPAALELRGDRVEQTVTRGWPA